MSSVFELGPQLVALFGKVGEGLGGGASVEEVGHWALRVYSFALFLIYSLVPECGYNVAIQSPASASMLSMSVAAMSSHLEGLYPPGTASQNKPFLH